MRKTWRRRSRAIGSRTAYRPSRLTRNSPPSPNRRQRREPLPAVMDHNVAGSFAARISGARTDMAAENIAAGTRTWAQTFHLWQTSPGHNANLLQSKADIVGVAVAHNEQTRYKTYWAMVIAQKP